MNNLDVSVLLRKRWRTIILVFACGVIISALAYIIVPKTYESRMKLLVKNERASLVVTPAGTDSPPNGDVSESTVNSEIELLRSSDLLSAVVVDAKLLPNGETSREAMEKETIRLNRKLKVNSIRKSNVIEVSYENTDAATAAFVLKDLGEKYLNAHVAAHSSPGAYELFNQQATAFHAQLDDARTALAFLRKRTGIFSVDQQKEAEISHLEDAQRQYNDLSVEVQGLEVKVSTTKSEIEGMPGRILTSDKNTPNQFALQQLKTSLTDLINHRIALLTKFEPSDRRVTELDAQIANTQAALHDVETGTLKEQTTDVNTVRSAIETDLNRDQAALIGLKTKRDALKDVIQSYQKHLAAMDQFSTNVRDLETKVQLASSDYQLYSRRLEEARLSESLDRQKIGNVTLIERPSVSFIPSPKLRVFVLSGAVIGLFIALSLAAFLEMAANPPTRINSFTD